MGLLTYEYRIGLSQIMISKTPVEDMVKKEVAFLMNVLPEGTEFLDAVPQPNDCTSMSKPFILTFGHPYFKNGTTLEVDRQRIIWLVGEGLPVERSEMFLGLRYLHPSVPIGLDIPICNDKRPVNPLAHLDDVGAPINYNQQSDPYKTIRKQIEIESESYKNTYRKEIQ